MPCSQTYQVNKRALSKAAQRDQSYRNCLGALLIFFFLCLILILACVPWKRLKEQSNNQANDGTQQSQVQHGKSTERPATTRIDNGIVENSEDFSTEGTQNRGSDTHESYKSGITRNKATTSTERIFTTDDEDYFTEGGPEYNTQQSKKDEGAIAVENISVTSRQVTDSVVNVEMTATSQSGPVTTDKYKYSSGRYLSSEKSELDMTTTRNIVTSTSSAQSVGLAEDVTTNSTNSYVTSEGTTRNVTSITWPTYGPAEATTDQYSSDEYHSSEKSRFDMTTDNIVTSTQSAGLAEGTTTNSTNGYVTDMSEVQGGISNVTSSTRPEEATTNQYSSEEYYTSKKSEFGIATDHIATATSSSPRSADLAENATTNSAGGYVKSIVKGATRNATSSTWPTRHTEEVTTNRYSSDENHSSKKSRFDMTTHNIVTPTQSAGLVEGAITNSTEYVTSISEVQGAIRNVTSSEWPNRRPEEATTNQYSSDEYYTSKKSELGMATDHIVTETSSSAGLAEDTTTDSPGEHVTSKFKGATYNVTSSTLSTQRAEEATAASSAEDTIADFTSGYVTSEANVAIDNAVSLTLSIRLDDNEENSTDTYTISNADAVTSSPTMNPSTNLEQSTNAGYSSAEDYYTQESQLVATIIYRIAKTTTPTTPTTIQFDSEEDDDTKYSTTEYLNREEEPVNTGYGKTLIDNNDVTEASSFVTEDYIPSKSFPATTEIINEAKDTTDVTASAKKQSEVAETYNVSVTSVATKKPSTHASASYSSTTSGTLITSSVSHINTTTMASPLPDEEKDVCTTEHCKRTASKMLSYMNHFADPCDDFYEYACGGFEANPQLIDGDLVRQSKTYQRIAKQMAKENHDNVHSTFATYYDSCVQYERTVNFNERVEMAINALKDVGKFYIFTTSSKNHTDFTNLFVQLILHHSALLFDVVPKFDEYRSTNFTLQISPPMYESPFMTGHADNLCSEDEFETEKQYVNLKDLYDSYKNCKKNTEEFLRSIKEALTVFSVFRGLDDSHLTWDLQSQYIEKTIHDVKSFIMQGYFSHFPSKDKIQEVYAMNTYDKISLEGLQSNTLVNWTQLIRSLIGADMMEANSISNNDLHIYLYDPLMKGLSELEKFADKDPIRLNNAIMALYAHKLYHELVLSRRNDVKDHCLQVATNLLRLEASSLYISSFSDQEIRNMDELIESSFNDLKSTLKYKTEQVEWAKENGQEGLLSKIDSLKLSLPAVSYYRDRDSLYNDYNMSQILYDNYFNNSMILLKRHRTLMYSVLRRQVDEERQVWAHHATPFQPKARVIYGLNLVVIPYGIIDWSSINEVHTLKYMLLATLGNLLAHQIAHHFDSNALYYWESSKNRVDEGGMTDYGVDLEDYINCHNDSLYQTSMNFTLPLTEQTVSLTIPRLTLNERLSDIVGLRLAYDTLALTRSDAGKRLPWIKLRIEQLFYLAYAQMYCTKSPLTSSYVSLYESEDLPNRIRVFVSASNNKFVADEWNCPMGSQVAPNEVCSVFPYIDFKETA